MSQYRAERCFNTSLSAHQKVKKLKKNKCPEFACDKMKCATQKWQSEANAWSDLLKCMEKKREKATTTRIDTNRQTSLCTMVSQMDLKPPKSKWLPSETRQNEKKGSTKRNDTPNQTMSNVEC